jgi:hypothetical protein
MCLYVMVVRDAACAIYVGLMTVPTSPQTDLSFDCYYVNV